LRLRTRSLLAQAPLIVALLFVVWSAWRLARVPAGPTLEARADRLETATLGAAAIAFVLGAVASVRLTNAILRPLSILGQAARRLAEGDLEARVVLSGAGELRALAQDWNAMASRLAELQRSNVGQLEEAQRQARAAIDSLSDPVIVCGLEGGVLEANDAAENLLGVHIDGDPERAMITVAPALRDALDGARSHVLAGKGPVAPRGPAEAVEVASPGGPRFWQVRALPLYGPQGSVEAVSVVVVDVTQARHIDELRDDVVATAAHELKTPLTSLRMAIHLCIEEAAGPVSPAQGDLLHSAREDCERIQVLVDDILDLARIQSGRTELDLETLEGEAIVEAAVEAHRQMAAEKAVSLRAEALPDGPTVRGDRQRLELVLGNFIANALRHTPAGGEVVVRCSTDDDGLRFEVEDTGEGISAEHQARVFDRFFRVPGRPTKGSGLGLAIAREIVVAHRGHIGVKSKEGRGSTFWFSLPAIAANDGP